MYPEHHAKLIGLIEMEKLRWYEKPFVFFFWNFGDWIVLPVSILLSWIFIAILYLIVYLIDWIFYVD